MSVEFVTTLACNIRCEYCYQNPMRDAGNVGLPLNIIKVKDALTKAKTDFSLFGGEPLLNPIDRLEEMFDFGLKTYGKNGIQTNGILITQAHLDLFKKYRVHMGVSIDGPHPINSVRCLEIETHKTLSAISEATRQGISVSVIVTIHLESLKNENLLMNFVEWLHINKVNAINFHPLEVDGCSGLALSDEQNLRLYKELYHKTKNYGINVHPFVDIESQLRGVGFSNCTWHACDPLTTRAVQGVAGDGELYNCGRTNKDGVNWRKVGSEGFERYAALYQTPQEYGGCKDCRYWFACKGQCPGTAIDGDWRNRTRDCQYWYGLMSFIEEEKRIFVNHHQRNKEAHDLLFSSSQDRPHVDSPHLDSPHGDHHGDSHGDHTDVNPGVAVTWIN